MVSALASMAGYLVLFLLIGGAVWASRVIGQRVGTNLIKSIEDEAHGR